MLSIPAAMSAQAATAATKASSTARPLAYLVQSMLAGAYIGVAVVLMLTAAGPLRAAGSPWAPLVQGLVFGVALTLVVAAGGELATSNMMTLTQGAVARTVGPGRAGTTLLFSFVGNAVGAFLFAAAVWESGVLGAGTPARAMLEDLLHHKSAATDGQLFWRGVLCNVLVCLAIWACARLTSDGARLAVIFWALLAFITSGFEHVVANMTTFGLGLVGSLAQVDAAAFGRNMLVVGLGNLVGGMVVGIAYATVAANGRAPVVPDGPAVLAEHEPVVLSTVRS